MTETVQETEPEVDTPQTGDESNAGAETNGEATQPAQTAVAVGSTKPPLPEGIVSPITARNHLVTQGLAPATLKPQQMYGFVKAPGKVDPFPVKHYGADGSVNETPQISEHGVTLTRPGVIIDEVVGWWKRKGERDKTRQAEKAQKAKDAAAKAAAAATGQAAAPAAATDTAVQEQAGEFPDASGEEVEAE